jgi:hypothetical protein
VGVAPTALGGGPLYRVGSGIFSTNSKTYSLKSLASLIWPINVAKDCLPTAVGTIAVAWLATKVSVRIANFCIWYDTPASVSETRSRRF